MKYLCKGLLEDMAHIEPIKNICDLENRVRAEPFGSFADDKMLFDLATNFICDGAKTREEQIRALNCINHLMGVPLNKDLTDDSGLQEYLVECTIGLQVLLPWWDDLHPYIDRSWTDPNANI